MLKYLGGGYIPGIPARDLTDKEVQKFGNELLVSTGLYAPPEPAKSARVQRPKEVINKEIDNE